MFTPYDKMLNAPAASKIPDIGIASTWDGFSGVRVDRPRPDHLPFGRRKWEREVLAAGDRCPLLWVVTEKVHGANLSIVARRTSDDAYTPAGGDVSFEFEVARRTGFIPEGDKFYNFEGAINPVKTAAVKLVERVCEAFDDSDNRVMAVQIYGELMGGHYPGLPKVDGAKCVQMDVNYCPQNEFFVFDVAITMSHRVPELEDDPLGYKFRELTTGLTEEEEKEAATPHRYYLTYTAMFDVVSDLFELWARPIAYGPLEACLKFDVEGMASVVSIDAINAFFDRDPAGRFGVSRADEAKAHRQIEGVVIRPLGGIRSFPAVPASKHLYFKKKAEAFMETRRLPGSIKDNGSRKPAKDNAWPKGCMLFARLTRTRLASVTSKIGRQPRADIDYVAGCLVSDAMDEEALTFSVSLDRIRGLRLFPDFEAAARSFVAAHTELWCLEWTGGDDEGDKDA